jgi:phospholipid/cholesterol/gamma-HCH transport system substrate-binding protein
MEAQRKVQMIVGGFLLFGLAAIMITVFMLGADKALFKTYAHLHAQFEQVQGLDRGSIVSLSGVAVGNVESIDFVNEQRVLDVTMKIEEKFLARIPEGSQVEIRTQGALGDKFIFIIPADGSEKTVKNGSQLEVAKATDIFNILSARGKETGQVFDIINDLHTMTKAINGEHQLEKIVSNLSKATENLSSTTNEVHRFTSALAAGNPDGKLNRSLERLESVMTKLDKGQGSLGALINDPTVHERLKALLGGNARKSQVKDLLRTSIEKAGSEK